MLPRKSCSYSPKHVNTLGAPFGGATKTRNGISFCREKAPFRREHWTRYSEARSVLLPASRSLPGDQQ